MSGNDGYFDLTVTQLPIDIGVVSAIDDERLKRDIEFAGGTGFMLEITDNGHHGDDCWIRCYYSERSKNDKPLVELHGTFAQIKTIRAALDSVIRLRENQAEIEASE